MLPRTRRILVIVAIVLATPLALLVGCLMLIESPWAERFVEARVGSMIHRKVEVQGIDIRLGNPLTVALGHLRIGNPDWATTPSFMDVKGLTAQVELGPLFGRRIVVPTLTGESGTVGLERSGDRATWRFGEGGSGKSHFQVQRIEVRDGDIAYRDPERKTTLDFKVSGGLGASDALKFTTVGTYKGLPAKGEGNVLRLPPTPGLSIPLDGKFTFGPTSIALKGEISPGGRVIDADFTLTGKTLHELQRLFGVNLPDTPPYKLSGHIKRDGPLWDWKPLVGKVGDSDITGSLVYDRTKPRGLLKADLHSKRLDLDDLGPLVGAPPQTGSGETASPEQRATAKVVAQGGRVLPRAPFHTERWGDMDADVRLQSKTVVRPKALPLETFSAHLVLKNSVMRVDPLDFGMAGGKFNLKVAIDATKKPVRGDVDIDVRGLQLNKLFPTVSSMNDSFGTLYGRGKLTGTGVSMGELLATSDGTLGLAVDGGRVSLFLVELLGLDFAEAIMMLGTKNKQVALRCAAGAFKVEKGRVEPERFIVDTTDTVVTVKGHADLGTERLHLTAYPEPKDMSIFALRSPIDIEGPFKKPNVKPRTGPIAARVAAAAALGAVSGPLAALAFIETGPGKDTDCGKLLGEARAASKDQPVAPKGQTAAPKGQIPEKAQKVS